MLYWLISIVFDDGYEVKWLVLIWSSWREIELVKINNLNVLKRIDDENNREEIIIVIKFNMRKKVLRN